MVSRIIQIDYQRFPPSSAWRGLRATRVIAAQLHSTAQHNTVPGQSVSRVREVRSGEVKAIWPGGPVTLQAGGCCSADRSFCLVDCMVAWPLAIHPMEACGASQDDSWVGHGTFDQGKGKPNPFGRFLRFCGRLLLRSRANEEDGQDGPSQA